MPHVVILEVKSFYRATVTIGHENLIKVLFLKILESVGSRSNGFKVKDTDEGSLCSTYILVDPNLGKDGSYSISKSQHGELHPKTGIKVQQLHIALLDVMQNNGWRMIRHTVDSSHQTREWLFELSL